MKSKHNLITNSESICICPICKKKNTLPSVKFNLTLDICNHFEEVGMLGSGGRYLWVFKKEVISNEI